MFQRRQFIRGAAGAATTPLFTGAVGALTTPLFAATADAQTGKAKPPQAKHLLFVVLNGGLSHIDSFDPKPALSKYAGKPPPESVVGKPDANPAAAAAAAPGVLQPSPWPARPRGGNGVEVSDLFPALGDMIDRFWLFRSMTTPAFAHGPALRQLITGHAESGHATIGAWIAHLLGADNPALPPFVTLTAGRFSVGDELWSAAYLPETCAAAVLRLDDPESWRAQLRQVEPPRAESLRREPPRAEPHRAGSLQTEPLPADQLRMDMDRRFAETTGFANTTARSERRAREQRLREVAGPLVEKVARKGQTAINYGDSVFARGCRLACDLIEKGTRAVQLFHGADSDGRSAWDCHDDLSRMEHHARAADTALTALVRDLEQRGLLDETLLVIATEFGRSPVAVATTTGPTAGRWGRDHNPHGFSALMTGSRLKAGKVWGATDELGLRAADQALAPQDLLANILTRFQIDPARATFRSRGRMMSPVDRGSHVIRDLRLG